MLNTRFVVLLSLSFSLVSGLSFAEEVPLNTASKILSEDDYIGDVPKVLTISRLPQSIADSPSAVTVIDRETIRAAGIVDLPEVFRLVPGFYVGTNAGYVHSTNHAVSYHGLTSAYSGAMQVMINGRSVYSPLYGGVQWSELPLAIADIDRIEITRGPNAASYGANSFFGVINIITQSPETMSSPAHSLIATHGNGRNEAFYRQAGKWDQLSYRVTTGFREDNGLRDRNDFKRTRLLNAQADYRVNDRNSLEFEFGLADGARGEGDINEDPIVFLPRTKQVNNHFELVRWRHNINENSDFTLQGYHSFDRSNDQASSIDIGTVLGPFVAPGTFIRSKIEVVSERYDVEAQHNFSIGPRVRAVWGGSIRQDSMYAPHYLGTDKKDYFDLQRVFGHAEWRAHEKLLFNAGAMIEHNDFTGTDISPRISINYQPVPNHTIRIGASSALRTPNYLEEKFNSGVSVPLVQPFPLIDPRTGLPFARALRQFYTSPGNVRPEQIVSREIAYIGKVGQLNFDTRLFHDSITDHIRLNERPFTAPPGFFIVPGTADDVYGGGNDGAASVNGIEAQLKWQLLARTQLLMNFAHVQVKETKDGLERNYEDAMPNNTFSALLTRRFNAQWDASFAYYQTSQASMLGDGDPVDLIRRADIRLARKFASGKWNGEIAAVVENVFNHHYEEFADYNTLGRRARLNVSLNY